MTFTGLEISCVCERNQWSETFFIGKFLPNCHWQLIKTIAKFSTTFPIQAALFWSVAMCFLDLNCSCLLWITSRRSLYKKNSRSALLFCVYNNNQLKLGGVTESARPEVHAIFMENCKLRLIVSVHKYKNNDIDY